MRRIIDRWTAAVCRGCPSPCCRFWYCREVARNPWSAFVNRAAGTFRVPDDWECRRDAFGLDGTGCAVRAGRYVFCYSYNCRRLLGALPSDDAREAFREVSELLLPANRLAGGRLLSELADPRDLSAADLDGIGRAVARASRRLAALERRLGRLFDPTVPVAAPQGDRRSVS